jgi:phosphatidylglycerol:prolipoprotein diacylglycerol transferase
LFNALWLAVVLWLRGQGMKSPAAYRFRGQHFHLYLIAYGTFRFFHEFLRDTPKLVGPISGYQIAALALVALGASGFYHRRIQHHLQR